ncbi:hypothetical protein M405DRAFT_830136 [Rhizopogon salebrosus TDB-379]|nr:hypothetical protein M405DRAFT_830136 [Rhizopogon salebrosus TDB-379]
MFHGCFLLCPLGLLSPLLRSWFGRPAPGLHHHSRLHTVVFLVTYYHLMKFILPLFLFELNVDRKCDPHHRTDRTSRIKDHL